MDVQMKQNQWSGHFLTFIHRWFVKSQEVILGLDELIRCLWSRKCSVNCVKSCWLSQATAFHVYVAIVSQFFCDYSLLLCFGEFFQYLYQHQLHQIEGHVESNVVVELAGQSLIHLIGMPYNINSLDICLLLPHLNQMIQPRDSDGITVHKYLKIIYMCPFANASMNILTMTHTYG